MKKKLIRAGILLVIFICGVAGFSSLMNYQSTDNKTDMETASSPSMAMMIEDTEVNRMYAYADDMDVRFVRDGLTPVGTDRSLKVSITPNGREIDSLVYEVCTSDGEQVIENNKIRSFTEEEDGRLTVEFTLSQPILMNQEYALTFTLSTEDGTWNYYTRILQRAGLSTAQYVEFVNSFYTKTFAQDDTGDLTTYLEPDTSVVSNSFRSLDIHSDVDMITWGDLNPQISRPGIPTIEDISENSGSISLTYYISAENENGEVEKYQVDEFYRMSYNQTRVYLLDFQRHVKQVLTTEQNLVSNGKINLGITDTDVQYMSDSTGTILAFVQQGDLWSYNIETNKMTRVFSFRDTGSNDERNDINRHDIKIVRISENGDIDFILYGYMNRGQHEGQVGTSVYHYSAEQNAMEEEFFLRSLQSSEFLQKDVEKLSYVSEDGNLYLLLEGNLYRFQMEEKTYEVLQEQIEDDCFFVSENSRYAAWMDGMDPYNTTSITFIDFNTGEQKTIQADQGTRIRLFGFINNDLIYGVANESDIVTNASGGTDFAMTEVRIQNFDGELVKSYHQDGYYVLDVTIQENLLELSRATKVGDSFAGTSGDQIMNNVRSKQDEVFSVITSTTVRQGNVTSIQFAADSSGQPPLVVDTKIIENPDRTLNMELSSESEDKYYVYGGGELSGIYDSASQAVAKAEEESGIVLNTAQQYIWEAGNTGDRASISAQDLPEAVAQASLDAAALNEALKGQGKVIDMTGCTLEQILYEVSAQRPVIAKGENGQAVVIIGYDDYNTILYNPSTQETYYFGMQDSTDTFQANGNVFLCYLEDIQ
ncbi:hypothetical protein [Blautia sp. An46]|uniref:hypothetical protein n=1 Tax=Blautia sp. An46 TaxID=1965636 RepID=UPI000B36E46D|nr:hypothetical protein [Blautia sp. An46]OUN92123.1 hypothetical protein B5G00_10570 [Blautia sp. An46]